MKKIIFISHDASRTGAPIVFLHLLHWLRQNTDYKFMIIIGVGGDMNQDFKSLGKTYILEDNNEGGAFSKIIKRIIIYPYRRIRIILASRLFRPSLIYANTLATLDVISFLKKQTSCPVICNVHELETAIEIMGLRKKLLTNKDLISQFLAVAPQLKENLIENYQINPGKIEVLPEFIPVGEIQKNQRDEESKDNFIVGGCGSGDWRKGLDIFVQTAAKFKQEENLKIKFIWVGKINREDEIKIKHDIKLLGVEDLIELAGSQEKPHTIFRKFGCFYLTSREDPYPLAALEAATMGIPIICFARSGGMVGFVEKGTGIIVPYLDIQKAAAAIVELSENLDLRLRLGKNAANEALSHDVDIIAPKIYQIIENQLKAGGHVSN